MTSPPSPRAVLVRRLVDQGIDLLVDDEWLPVPGVANVEVTTEPPAAAAPNRTNRADRRHSRARPAWQSPYGPPTHRH